MTFVKIRVTLILAVILHVRICILIRVHWPKKQSYTTWCGKCRTHNALRDRSMSGQPRWLL